mgnify:CR=1 FL=1
MIPKPTPRIHSRAFLDPVPSYSERILPPTGKLLPREYVRELFS